MSLLFRSAQFDRSAAKFSQCPNDSGEDAGREVAFVGRSNAGKSSAINTITGIPALCRTSKQPGRTQLINFFNLDDGNRLVDLPGYGYAKVPKEVQRRWLALMQEYFERRQSLCGVVMLMDCRHPLTDLDAQMLDWLVSYHIPVHILLTKADKLSKSAAKSTLLSVEKTLRDGIEAPPPSDQLPDWTLEEYVSIQLFSSLKESGLKQARQKLEQWLLGDR